MFLENGLSSARDRCGLNSYLEFCLSKIDDEINSAYQVD